MPSSFDSVLAPRAGNDAAHIQGEHLHLNLPENTLEARPEASLLGGSRALELVIGASPHRAPLWFVFFLPCFSVFPAYEPSLCLFSVHPSVAGGVISLVLVFICPMLFCRNRIGNVGG